MVAIVGYEGNVTLPSGGGVLDVWSARITRVTSETTAFGHTIHRTNRAGLKDITGTASGKAGDAVGDAPDIQTLPADGGASMTLTVQAGNTIAFVGLISGIGFDVDKEGDSVVTYDFVTGDGDTLTEVWA